MSCLTDSCRNALIGVSMFVNHTFQVDQEHPPSPGGLVNSPLIRNGILREVFIFISSVFFPLIFSSNPSDELARRMVLSWIWLWMWDKIAKPSARSRSSSCFQSIRALYPICSGLHDSDNDQKKEERHHESRRTLVLTSQFSHNRPLWISLIFASGEGYMYYLFWYMYSVMPHYFPNHLSVHNVERLLIAYLILKKSSRWNWQRAQIQVTRRMSNMATCYMYMSHSLLAYLILAIRRARLDQRRPATYLIMSRNCARITPGAPIEPENFDRRKRREHGDVVVTYIHSLDYCDKSWNTPSYLCKQSQLPQVRIIVIVVMK